MTAIFMADDSERQRLIDGSGCSAFNKIPILSVRYPMPPNIPPLSDIIGLCRDPHTVAHSGQIKTIVKHEIFLPECTLYFASNLISEKTVSVCSPILQRRNTAYTR